MFVFAQTKKTNDFAITFKYTKYDDYEYEFVSQYVWDTDNDFSGFKFPVLVVTGIPTQHNENESVLDFGFADNTLVYKFSPRDMLIVHDYLESIDYSWSDSCDDENNETDENSIIPINQRCFMFEFVRRELEKTEESKELQELMYSEVFLFFKDVFENYLLWKNKTASDE